MSVINPFVDIPTHDAFDVVGLILMQAKEKKKLNEVESEEGPLGIFAFS